MLDAIRFLVQIIIGARCKKLMESIGGARRFRAGGEAGESNSSRVCGVAAALRGLDCSCASVDPQHMQPDDSPEPSK
jgi:hypothetical protein